jgi:polysaccharide biosynthesis transport protein
MNIQNNLEQDSHPVLEDGDGHLPQEPGIQLLDLLRIVRTRWQMIAGTVAIVMALTVVVVFELTPLYTANAVVMLDQRKNNVEDVNAVLSGLPTDPTSIQNQVQILSSRGLANRVIERLRLDLDPEFNSKLSGWTKFLGALLPTNWFKQGVSTHTTADETNDERNKIIDAFSRHVSVDPIGLSTAITVSFESPDAAKSARIANTIADEYVEDQLNAKFEATQKATQWLSNRIQQLSQQVQSADAAVQQYRAENNLSDATDGISVVDQQLASVNGQLILAKSDLAQKEANYGRVSSLVHSGHAADVSQVVASPLIATLRAQETEMLRQEADLSTQFGPRHPKILELESEKKNLQGKIGEEVQRVVETVASDVAVAQANVHSLEDSLAQLEGKSHDQSKASVRLKALEAAASSSRSMYEAYMSRLKEAQGQEGIQAPDARVISTAEVPGSPSSPKKGLAFGLALPASLLLGFMLALTAERLDSGFRTTPQVESTLGLPVLSIVPEIKASNRGEQINAADRIIDKPMSSFAEAIRGLQLALSLSNVDAEPKVVIVSSSVPGEGKTTIAISLARLASRAGKKVIIVDGDLRRPTVAKTIGLTAAEFDISDALSGKAALDRCIVKDPRSDAMVLPCMQTPPSPADLLLSVSMEKLVANLRGVFDLVIIDSAPLLPVNDTKILSRLCDTILFVTRWEKTPRDAARNAIRALHDVKAPIAGIALARADNKRFQYYNYGYQNYAYYNKYYND